MHPDLYSSTHAPVARTESAYSATELRLSRQDSRLPADPKPVRVEAVQANSELRTSRSSTTVSRSPSPRDEEPVKRPQSEEAQRRPTEEAKRRPEEVKRQAAELQRTKDLKDKESHTSETPDSTKSHKHKHSLFKKDKHKKEDEGK